VHAIARIRARYLGARRAGMGIYSHCEVLANSAFCAVDTLTWSWSRQLTVEEVTGLQLSYSFSTPALLGDKARAFSSDVRAAVLGLYPAQPSSPAPSGRAPDHGALPGLPPGHAFA
jgi:hypothetical protein